jgi:Mn2+/Fe2+ NRAMP family transporter
VTALPPKPVRNCQIACDATPRLPFAVLVLAGSAANARGEALGWPTGLARLPRDAKAFSGTIIVGTLIGVFIDFIDLDPIKALFWSAVVNSVVEMPQMIMMTIMIMATQKKVMGAFALPRPLWVLGWLCTAAMAVAGSSRS